MNLEAGKSYWNGLGDKIGPLVERASDCFVAEDGSGPYFENGRQWGHAPQSKGNLIAEAKP